MPFDPILPINCEIIDADVLRAQFLGLEERIDAIAAGPPGEPGPLGPQGPAFSTAVVDSVNTLNPGESAVVTVYFDGTYARFSFGLPRGADGVPREVSYNQMTGNIAAAIGETARNSASIGPFAGTFSNPPTQAEMLAFAAYMESLRVALVR